MGTRLCGSGASTGSRPRRDAGARGRRTLAVLAAWVLMPAGLVAQRVEHLQCPTGSPVGSLGITGIACDRCQFYTNGEVHRAVFWTEPTVQDLNPKMAAAAVLKRGDVLVAVDGELITTREGSARFSALPDSGSVKLRIRRGGQVRDVSVPVTAVCPTDKTAPEVAGRPLPPAPMPAKASPVSPPAPPAKVTAPAPSPKATLPPPPAKAALPAAPAEAPLPAPPPAPDAILPRAELGFAFTCTNCTYESAHGGRWTFPEAPTVSAVSTAADGTSSGLLPGDRILKVNGKDITTAEGARAFGAIVPGDHPRWTVERDGRDVTVVTVARRQESLVARTRSRETVELSRAPLRYSGTVGNTLVEVRGGKVNVMATQGDSLVIIRTGDAEIRIRVPRPGGN